MRDDPGRRHGLRVAYVRQTGRALENAVELWNRSRANNKERKVYHREDLQAFRERTGRRIRIRRRQGEPVSEERRRFRLRVISNSLREEPWSGLAAAVGRTPKDGHVDLEFDD